MEYENEIFFYSHAEGKPHNYMSNFYPCDFIDLDTKTIYTSSEQYIMHAKAVIFEPNNYTLHFKILDTRDPAIVKALGRHIINYNEARWEAARPEVISRALYWKFSQNPTIKARLLATAPKMLYEAAKFDNIWGIGYAPETARDAPRATFGQNLLGIALMQVRDRLK